MEKTEIHKAIDVLRKTLKEDESYRDTWVANLAMAFQDQFHADHRHHGIHQISNDAAERFIQNLCRDGSE